MKELEDHARALEGVVHVETVDYLCHPEARERMASVVRGDHLDRVVVAACSPRLYLKEFQDAVATVGLAGCMVEMANIREQCAWVHSEQPIGATRKAEDLVSMAAAKLARVKTGEGGSVSMVKPELCSGCGVCEATCRLSAIKMVPDVGRPGKRIATVLPKVCEGCGACVAACPAAAMDQACFSNEEIGAMIDAATMPVASEEENFPNVLVFTCHWCSYAAGDLAGIKRLQLPDGFRTIRTMCSARVDPEWVMRALSRGADGVLILAGKPGRCHYEVGSIRTNRRMTLLKSVITQLGFDESRFLTVYVDSDEAELYQKTISEFVTKINEVGPNPLRLPEKQEFKTVDYQFAGVPESAKVGYRR